MPKRCWNTVFVTNKRVAKKNRRQKVFLFFSFFQPICKFSGRSDKLLAAGAKGLTWLHSPLQGSCDGLHLPLHSFTLVSLSRVHWSVPHSFSPASHTPLHFFQVVLFGRHSPLHSFLFGWSFSRIHWFPHFIGKPWWCCYLTVDPETPASQTGESYYRVF